MQVSWHSLACSRPPHFIMLPPQILITDLRLPSTHVPFGVWSFSISDRSLKFYNWDFFFQKRKTLTQMVLTLLSLSGVAATCNSKRSSVSMLANSSPFSSEPRNKKKKNDRSKKHDLFFIFQNVAAPPTLQPALQLLGKDDFPHLWAWQWGSRQLLDGGCGSLAACSTSWGVSRPAWRQSEGREGLIV